MRAAFPHVHPGDALKQHEAKHSLKSSKGNSADKSGSDCQVPDSKGLRGAGCGNMENMTDLPKDHPRAGLLLWRSLQVCWLPHAWNPDKVQLLQGRALRIYGVLAGELSQDSRQQRPPPFFTLLDSRHPATCSWLCRRQQCVRRVSFLKLEWHCTPRRKVRNVITADPFLLLHRSRTSSAQTVTLLLRWTSRAQC